MLWVGTAFGTGPVALILVQPLGQIVLFQGSATFSVVASSGTTMTYQWYKNGTNAIYNANASSYTISNVHPNDAATYSVKITNGGGTITSSDATLTVVSAPEIDTSPTNQTVIQGQTAYFYVQAEGSNPLNYQWYLNGTAVAGATSSVIVITNAQYKGDAGYSVVVGNLYGSVTSRVASLKVIVPPSIANQPQSQAVTAGGSTSFKVTAGGTSPLYYHWYLNGASVANGTNATLSVPNAGTADAGNYRVLVSNSGGAVTSSVAALTVSVPITSSSLVLGINGNAKMMAGGFSFQLSVPANVTYVIQASTDMQNWQSVSTNISTSNTAVFTDTAAANYSSRFYRAVVYNAGSPLAQSQ